MNKHMYGLARIAGVAGAAALGVALLAGCDSGEGSGGGSGQADDGAPGTASTASEAPPTVTTVAPSPSPSSPSATPTVTPAPADGSDTAACFDGSCEVAVPGPMTISVSSRFGFTKFKITEIGSSGVTVAATTTGGTSLQSSVSPGGTLGLNSLTIRVESVTGHAAVLALSPAG